MQATQDALIRLLIVNDHEEDAEAIVSNLRNLGLPIRPSRPANQDELRALLAQQVFDVVMVSPGGAIPEREVFELARAGGRDLPVVMLMERLDEKSLEFLARGGVRNLALRNRYDLMRDAVEREFNDVQARRAVRRLEVQVSETERRCDALIESSRDPIAYVHEGMYIRANSAYLDMFGYGDFEDIEGMSLLDMVAPSHVNAFKQLLKDLGRGDAPPPRYELQARDAEGHDFPALMEFTQAKYEGEPCIQVVIRRQEGDLALMQEMEELRRRDIASGLLNRPTFLQELEQLVGKVATDRSTHGLLLMSPDRATQLGEQVGLDNVDDLAAAIARRLGETFGDAATLARIGEDTYAVLLRGSAFAATAAAAERLRAAFSEQLLETPEASLSTTVSIGGVQIGERIAQVARVLSKATESLQNASDMGGNRIEIFDPSATERAEEERIQSWVGRIREAIESDTLRFHYQPIVNLHDESERFQEALLRMLGSDGHLIPPVQFAPMAEEHGLAPALDRWALRRALLDVAALPPGGAPAKVLVKISQTSLDDAQLVADINRMLEETGVSASSLVLQLPESKVFTNLRQAQKFCAELASIGAHFCIEHFGSGINSLQLLNHLAPRYLKIDEDFIADFGRDSDNRERVQEIVQAAGARGIACIARGVKDAATMTALFTSGVEYMQGDFIAPASERMNAAY